MNALITGAAGFIGRFLARHAMNEGWEVLGIDSAALTADWPAKGAFEHCDVRDEAALEQIIRKFRPDRVFHLAAQSYPTVSLEKPRETMDSNVGGTINLFESLRRLNMKPRVVVACSSAEYGMVARENLPVKETHPLRPLHPYGVSKVGQDLLTAQYFENYGFHAIRIRIFNTTGPSKLGDVCSDLIKRAVEIENGVRDKVLPVGNTNTRRAIIDVRDMVRGLWIASESCDPGDVYNVGSNSIYSVEELIETIRARVKVPFMVQRQQDLVRACDEPVIAGDVTKFRERTGWSARIPLDQTIDDMLTWWRQNISHDLVLARSKGSADAV